MISTSCLRTLILRRVCKYQILGRSPNARNSLIASVLSHLIYKIDFEQKQQLLDCERVTWQDGCRFAMYWHQYDACEYCDVDRAICVRAGKTLKAGDNFIRWPQQDDFNKLFEDLDLASTKLGRSPNARNSLIASR